MFTTISFFAGMSSYDLGALGTLVHLCVMGSFAAKRQLPKGRYLLPAVAFIGGFVTLYLAPGNKIRASYLEDYVSLSQNISWLLSFEWSILANHYLDVLGQSMNRTTYLIALASLSTVWFICRLQKKYHFMPLKWWHLVSGYLCGVFTLLGLLYAGSEKPSGESLGGVILFANFVISLIAGVFLLKRKSLIQDNYEQYVAITLLHILIIINVSAYVVGFIPGRRTYMTASFMAALNLALMIQLSWPILARKIVFYPMLTISMLMLSLHTVGLNITESYVINAAVSKASEEDEVIIHQTYYLLHIRPKQFKDWETLSTDKTNWANQCAAEYYQVKSVALAKGEDKLPLTQYIRYLFGTLQGQ